MLERNPRCFARTSVRRGWWHLALLPLLLLGAGATGAPAIELPPGFEDDPLPIGFVQPTCIRFLPDGRLLVAERRGRLYLVEGGQARLLWEDEARVHGSAFDNHGLLAIEVDPAFPAGRWIYLLYSVDPDSNGVDDAPDLWGRLERRLLSPDEMSLDASSRDVLLGTSWSDGFLHGGSSHASGALAWGSDGTLLVSSGDGAQFEVTDAGGNDPGLFLPGRGDPGDDIGAFRSHRLASLNGKILRLDPGSGHGLPSNPFWDGDPASVRSRVFAYGLRNPFRFAVRPGSGSPDPASGDPGTLYVGDVGLDTWEEINVAGVAGTDFGWPCFEGPSALPAFQGANPAHDGCEPTDPPAIGPLLAFHHDAPDSSTTPGVAGSCLIGGVFYRGGGYPAGYYGGFFFADFVGLWIKVLRTDSADGFVELLDFASDVGGMVSFALEPGTGDVWFASIGQGVIHRIRHTGVVSVVAAAADAPALALVVRPNPAPGAARFHFTLPAGADARLAIHDALGREVWSAEERALPAGPHVITWPGTRRGAGPAPVGIYFAKLRSGGRTAVRRFAVVR